MGARAYMAVLMRLRLITVYLVWVYNICLKNTIQPRLGLFISRSRLFKLRPSTARVINLASIK